MGKITSYTLKRREWLWGLPIILLSGHRSPPPRVGWGVLKWHGCEVHHSCHSSAEVKNDVQLYLYPLVFLNSGGCPIGYKIFPLVPWTWLEERSNASPVVSASLAPSPFILHHPIVSVWPHLCPLSLGVRDCIRRITERLQAPFLAVFITECLFDACACEISVCRSPKQRCWTSCLPVKADLFRLNSVIVLHSSQFSGYRNKALGHGNLFIRLIYSVSWHTD